MSRLLKVLFVSLILPITTFAAENLSSFCDKDPSKDYIAEGTVNTILLKEICDLEREREQVVAAYQKRINVSSQKIMYDIYISTYNVDPQTLKSKIENIVLSIKPDAKINFDMKSGDFSLIAFHEEALKIWLNIQSQTTIPKDNIAVDIEPIGAGFKKTFH